MIAIPMRPRVYTAAGVPIGYVTYSEGLKKVKLAGGVSIPREYQLHIGGADGPETDPLVTVSYTVADGGVPVIESVTVDGGDISPKVFDAIRRQLTNWNRAALNTVMATVTAADGGTVTTPEVGERNRRAATKEIDRRKSKFTEEFLQSVADVYLAAEPGDAWEAVRKEFGVALQTAGGYIFRARAAGLLPETTPGKVTK